MEPAPRQSFQDVLAWVDQRATRLESDRAQLTHWLNELEQLRRRIAPPKPATELPAKPAGKKIETVICANCQQPVSASAKFCSQCGAKRCQHCGEFTAPGKFCNQCGAKQ